MMLTRAKRRYAGILIAGALALAVDRFLFSANSGVPATAAAITVSGDSFELPQATELAIPALPFPRGIAPVDPQSAIPDLFKPPRLSANEGSDALNADKLASAHRELSGQLDHSAFEAKHHLKAVLVNQRLKIANVDGQWMRIGDSLDGCGCIEISGREVRFECHDDEAVLRVNVKMLRSGG